MYSGIVAPWFHRARFFCYLACATPFCFAPNVTALHDVYIYGEYHRPGQEKEKELPKRLREFQLEATGVAAQKRWSTLNQDAGRCTFSLGGSPLLQEKSYWRSEQMLSVASSVFIVNNSDFAVL